MAVSNSRALDLVKSCLTTMMRKDYDAGLKLLSDDCEYTNVPLSTVRGPSGVRAVLEPFFAPTLENEFIVKHELTDGALVFLERIDRHRLASGWVELPVNGVFEVRDGRIALWRDYFDAATILTKWPTS